MSDEDVRRAISALKQAPMPRADAAIRFGWLVVGTLVAGAALYATFILGGQNATQLELIRELRADIVSLRSQVDALERQVVDLGGDPITQSSDDTRSEGRQSERPVQASTPRSTAPPAGDSPDPDPTPTGNPTTSPTPTSPPTAVPTATETAIEVCVGPVCVTVPPPDLPATGATP